VDVIVLFGVDDGDDIASQKPQGYESLFAIAETVIFICVRDASEHFFGVNEIEAVFLEIDTPFSLIPSDHETIVYTIRICVKGKNSPLQNGLLDEFLHPGFTWHPPAAFRLGWTRPLGNVLVTNRTRTSARSKPNGVSRTVSGPSSRLSALGSRLWSPCPPAQTAALRRGL